MLLHDYFELNLNESSLRNKFLILEKYCNNCNYLFRAERRKNNLFFTMNHIAIIIYQGLISTSTRKHILFLNRNISLIREYYMNVNT